MLEHGYRDEPWHTSYAVVDRLDNLQKLMRVTYRFTGAPPDETFTVYSRVVQPVHEKVRDIRLFDRTMLRERIVWLPLGTLEWRSTARTSRCAPRTRSRVSSG